MKWTETSIVILYFIICIAIGLYYKNRSSENLNEYYTAGGKIGLPINVLASFAAFASGGSTLGGIGFAYTFGVPFTWASVLGSIQGFILAAVLVAPYLRNMNIRTISDFFKKRYQWKLITVASGFIVLIAFSVYLVSQYKGAAITAQFLLNWNYGTALLLIAVVYILYVSIGGMWAVTMTDAFQAALMFLAVIGLGIVSIVQFGGISSLFSQVLEFSPSWASNTLPPVSLIGFALLWLATVVCMPHIVMRALSAKNSDVAKKTFGYTGLVYGVMALIGFIGISGAAVILFPPGSEQALADSDLAMLGVMQEFFPPVLQGIGSAAIMAAIMSSTDALLIAISAAVSNDILHNLFPDISEKSLLKIGNLSIWVFGALSAVLAINPPALLALLFSNAVGVLTTGFFWPLVLGIWWKKANKYGALASMISGSGLYIILVVLEWYNILTLPLFVSFIIAFIIAFIVNVVVNLVVDVAEDEGLNLMETIHSVKSVNTELLVKSQDQLKA